MSKRNRSVRGAGGRKISQLRRLSGLGLGLPAVLAMAPAAHAFQVYDGSSSGNNVEINLNITASYTGLYRVGKASPVLASSA
uniref:hypothetical protein n=1 Tax=Acidocella sp. TaxID=50710 RepID=UPI002626E60C